MILHNQLFPCKMIPIQTHSIFLTEKKYNKNIYQYYWLMNKNAIVK